MEEKQLNWLSGEPLSREDLKKSQMEDSDVSWMLECKEKRTKLAWTIVASRRADSKAYWGQWESLQVHHGLLCREKRRDGEKRTEEEQEDAHRRRVWVQVVVPQMLRKEVFRAMHDALTVGH